MSRVCGSRASDAKISAHRDETLRAWIRVGFVRQSPRKDQWPPSHCQRVGARNFLWRLLTNQGVRATVPSRTARSRRVPALHPWGGLLESAGITGMRSWQLSLFLKPCHRTSSGAAFTGCRSWHIHQRTVIAATGAGGPADECARWGAVPFGRIPLWQTVT